MAEFVPLLPGIPKPTLQDRMGYGADVSLATEDDLALPANPPPPAIPPVKTRQTIQATDVTPAVDNIGIGGVASPDKIPSGLSPVFNETPWPNKKEPEFSDVLSAEFSLTNDVVAAVRGLSSKQYEPEPGFNPLDIIKGTHYEEDWLDNFVGVHSAAQTRDVMAAIDQAEKDAALVASSSWGWVAGMASGVASPLTLLPVGGVLRIGKVAARSGKIALGAVEGAAMVGGTVAAQEAILQTFNETRTAEESWWAIAGATVLGGALGGAARGLARGDLKKLADDVGIVGEPAKAPAVTQPTPIKYKSSNDVHKAIEGEEAIYQGGGGDLTGKPGPRDTYKLAVENNIPKEIQNQYWAHGISSTRGDTRTDALIGMIRDKSTSYHAGRLLGDDGLAGGGGLTRFRAPYILVMKDGDPPAAWRYVVVNTKNKDIVDSVRELLPKDGPEVVDPETFVKRILGIESAPPPATSSFSGTGMASGLGAEAVVRNTAKLKGAAGLEGGVAMQTGPLPRTQTSINPEVRNTVRDLDGSLRLEENAEGVATSAGGNASAIAKSYGGNLAIAVSDLDISFQRYFFGQETRFAPARATFARVVQGVDKLSAKQFREAVYDAMDNGDVHHIAEVQNAARSFRKNLYDVMAKEGIDARLWTPEQIARVVGARGYAPRSYLAHVISKRTKEFTDILTRNFEANRAALERDIAALEAKGEEVSPGMIEASRLSLAEVRDMAEQVVNDIMGHSANRIIGPQDFVGLPRGFAKERMLNIPLSEIRDFVDRDITAVSGKYVHSMGMDIALMKKFGSLSLDSQIAKIKDWYTRAINNAKTQAQSGNLNKLMRRDLNDLEAMVQRMRGTYGLPDNVEGLTYRAVKVVKDLNFLAKMGGILLSSIPDIGHIVTNYGLAGTFKTAFSPFVNGLKTTKLAAKEAKLAGAALDLIIDSRLSSIADIVDGSGRGSRFERGLSATTKAFSIATGMPLWNVTLKQFTGMVAQTKMLGAIESLMKGRATAKEIEWLASAGIDKDIAGRIFKEAKHWKSDKSLRWANTSEWTDQEAVRAFRATLVHEVDRTIITPGQERPLIFSKGFGVLLGQFRSFSMAAMQKNLIAGLQQRDLHALEGLLTMLALGAISYKVKSVISGRETSDKLEKWAVEAFDNSGILGWFMDANNIAEKLTNGQYGLAAFTGEQSQRYASRNVAGAILGPSFDVGMDTLGIANAMATGKWTQSDSRALRRMIPLQNLFYMRNLFDKVEAGTNNALGIPARAQ